MAMTFKSTGLNQSIEDEDEDVLLTRQLVGFPHLTYILKSSLPSDFSILAPT